MEIIIALGVLAVCATLYWSMIRMSDALNRLTASVAAIGADVAGIADAIRNHINGDAGISQDALNALADQLDEAGAKLKGLETGLESPPSDVPVAAPGADVPPVDGGPTEPPTADDGQSDLAGGASDLPADGNQNGIGSDFSEGVDGLSDAGRDGGPHDQSPEGGAPVEPTI